MVLKLKRMSSHNQARNDEPIVQSLGGLTDQDQAEAIAEQFSQISNQYEPLNSGDICMENISNDVEKIVFPIDYVIQQSS